MWWMLMGLAAAAEAGPSWISAAQGTARAELLAVPTQPVPEHEDLRCRGQVRIAGDTLQITADPEKGRTPPSCGKAFLRHLQSQAESWRIVVRSYRPRAAYSLSVDFVTGPEGALHLEVQPDDYAVGDRHPEAVHLVEPGRRLPQRGRVPRLSAQAQQAVAAGAAANPCSVVLQITPRGRVASAQASESCDPHLRSHAEALASRMRFTPHLVNGQAVPRSLSVSVRIQP